LLHDWPADAALRPPVLDELRSLVTEGKVGALGIASSAREALTILRSGEKIFQVVQFENSLMRPAHRTIGYAGSSLVVTHRALADTFESLKQVLQLRPGLRDVWRLELGIDPAQEFLLSGLLVRWALARNPNGTVLFSTTSSEHLKANAELLAKPILTQQVMLQLETLVDEIRSVAAELPRAWGKHDR
jgi:aryl-alcohol dehydrogenase-like predicted oxidoreductase